MLPCVFSFQQIVFVCRAHPILTLLLSIAFNAVWSLILLLFVVGRSKMVPRDGRLLVFMSLYSHCILTLGRLVPDRWNGDTSAL